MNEHQYIINLYKLAKYHKMFRQQLSELSYNLQVVVLLESWMVGQTNPAGAARELGSLPR